MNIKELDQVFLRSAPDINNDFVTPGPGRTASPALHPELKYKSKPAGSLMYKFLQFRFLTGYLSILALALFFNPDSAAAQNGDADFRVSTASVDESYPNFDDAHPVVYTINGVQGKELTLYRGQTYTFEIDATGHPFFFTTEQGGANNYAGEITNGVENSRAQDGVVTVTVDEDLPDEIYYECGFHTNMGGVIQVQDLPEPAITDYRARLSGANEVPPVFTTATGHITASLDGAELTLSGSFEGLESPVEPIAETGVHIHAGFAGQNGGVEVVLTPELSDGDTAGDIDETITLTGEQLNMLENRRLYINIHTEGNPAGELRGQLVPDGPAGFQTYASGGYKVPANVSLAQGGLFLEWDGSDLVVSGAFEGLSEPYIDEVGETGSGAHLHVGFAGENGPVELSLTAQTSEDGLSGVFHPMENTFEDVDSDIAERLAGRQHYLNIHSEAYPAGEIRGQVVPEADIYFYAPLSSGIEKFGNTSEGRGAVLVEWYADESEIVLTGAFSDLGSDYDTGIGSHIHVGYAGQSGGVLVANPASVGDDNRSGSYHPGENTFMLEPEDVALLVNRQTYFNVHTAEWPGGEIRGSLLPFAQHYFAANLTGEAEVQPVFTDAFGGIVAELRGNRLTVSGSFSDLGSNFNESPGAHIHYGRAGENGSVAFPFDVDTGDAEDARDGVVAGPANTFELTEHDILALAAGELYVNIHSEENQPGEIRGQLLLDPNSAPVDDPAITAPGDGAEIVIEGDAGTPFVPQWNSSEDPDGDRVVYVWQLALDEDFENVVFAANAGEEEELNLTFADVDGLLDDLGVEPGTEAVVYHRALATDGSYFHIGSGASVTIERGVLTSGEKETELADRFELRQNYPNPFNPATTIQFVLPERAQTTLRVYNAIGREVATLVDENLSAGTHEVTFDAASLSSGIYLYRLEAGSFRQTQKMILAK